VRVHLRPDLAVCLLAGRERPRAAAAVRQGGGGVVGVAGARDVLRVDGSLIESRNVR
jgi:hypothetical protein